MTGPTLRSDIPEERDLARVEAIAAYRERVGWVRCGACGEMEAWNPETQEFIEDCDCQRRLDEQTIRNRVRGMATDV